MKNAPTLPKKSPRRFKFKTVSFEDSDSDEVYFPYAQCLCDLDDSMTRGHAPTCPQLHISPYHQAAYPEVEGDAAGPRGRRGNSESNKRKGTIRRQQKKEKRLRDIEARSEMLKAAKQATEPYAQCRCSDGFSDSEEEALRGQSRMFYDGYTGGCSVHSPRCRKRRLDHITPRGSKLSPSKSTSYIDLEEKETTRSRRKKKRTARLPPKSKGYIDLEDDDEEEDQGLSSAPATRYDPKTIVSDFLRAIGKHPYLPPLNAHMKELPTSTKSRSSKSCG